MAEDPGDAGRDIARLVAEHHQPVYRYAYRLTGSVHDAEDLTQQTFLIAQRKIGGLRKMDAARSWLFAILRNCFLRERQRRRPALAADLSLNMDFVPAAGAMMRSTTTNSRLSIAFPTCFGWPW